MVAYVNFLKDTQKNDPWLQHGNHMEDYGEAFFREFAWRGKPYTLNRKRKRCRSKAMADRSRTWTWHGLLGLGLRG